MPKTTKKEYILPTEETLEEIKNIWIKYLDSIVEIGEGSKLVGANIQVDGQTHFDSISFDTEIAEEPTETGSMFWDSQDKTVAIVLEPSNGGVVKLQLGQETYVRAVNKTGTTISNGSVVFISGSQGNRPTIDLAEADVYDNASRTIGVATEDIGDNLFGYVTIQGVVRDLNTVDYTEGDCVYLSETAGAFTTVTPSDGNARVRVGVITKSHNNDGALQVCIKEDKYMFGDVDNDNYSYFEADGTLKFVGDATVWKDENAGGVSLTKANSNQPDLIKIDTTDILTYALDGGTSVEELHWSNELQHDWKIGTNIQPHAHFYTTDTGTGFVKLNLDVWVSNGGTASYTTSTSLVQGVNGNAWEQFRVDFADEIAGSNLSFSAQMHFRIYRDPTDILDTYTGDIALGTLGYHYEIDTVGSRQTTTK